MKNLCQFQGTKSQTPSPYLSEAPVAGWSGTEKSFMHNLNFSFSEGTDKRYFIGALIFLREYKCVSVIWKKGLEFGVEK